MSNVTLIERVGKDELKTIEEVAKREIETLKVMVANQSYDLCRQVIFRNMRYSVVRNKMANKVLEKIKEGADPEIENTSYARAYKVFAKQTELACDALIYVMGRDDRSEFQAKMLNFLTRGLKKEIVSSCTYVMSKYADEVLEKLEE